MKVSFNLKNPGAEVSSVRLVVTHLGKVYRRSTGISVKTSQWRKSKRGGQGATRPADAERLKRIRLALEERLDERSSLSEVEEAVDAVLSGETDGMRDERHRGRPSFWEYFEAWSGRDLPSARQRRRIRKLIGELMGEKEDWEEIDSAYYFRLVRKMNKAEYSHNYQSAVISKLRSVMSEGYRLKYHRNEDFKRFAKSWEQPDAVYLTEDELQRIWDVELTDETERSARDLFLIGCYTAARFSDYSRLSYDNIHDGLITFSQKKTADTVIMPLSAKVKTLLDRNSGAAPKISHGAFNREIKAVCLKAGINAKVQVTKSRGERHLTAFEPKWKLVSSHTARRTGATLLYMSGVPIAQCMMITGHKSEATFRRYIRLTKEENARSLAGNPFFK